jgi:hypothetical protein
MQIYPYNHPIIMDDDQFVAYGGQTGTTTPAQRQAAYLIAEKQATNHIGTFLLPTIVTGTFPWQGERYIVTDYGYVWSVPSVTLIYIGNNCVLTEKAGCGAIRDDTFGYVDLQCVCSNCGGGCGSYSGPLQIQMVYQAGLPTGSASQADFLLGLAIAASISLNEMAFPSANESAGDVGVEEFRSMDYSERRKSSAMKRTAFGSSARANKAAQLIEGSVRRAQRPLVL